MLVTGAPASWFGIKVLTPRPRAVKGARADDEDDDESGEVCGNGTLYPNRPISNTRTTWTREMISALTETAAIMAQVGSGESRTRFQEPHLSPHDKIDGQHVETSGHDSISDEPRDVVSDEEAATDGAAALVPCGRADKDEEDDGEPDREDGADRVQPEIELLVVDLATRQL